MSQKDGGHGIDLVLVELEGELRGFKNKLSFVRFCNRMGVKVHQCGRKGFVSRKELEDRIRGAGQDNDPLDELVDNYTREGA